MNWIYVFIGGGVGSIGRYAIWLLFKNGTSEFPWATLLSNILAALIIGVLYFIGLKNSASQSWLLLATGFCGGLSTFSAFSLETFQLFRSGNHQYAWLNIAGSILLCVFAIWILSKLMVQKPC